MSVREDALPGNHLAAYVAAAALLFTPLFLFARAGVVDFFWWMSAVVAVLSALAFLFDRGYASLALEDLRHAQLKKALLGAVSAAALFAVFFAGNEISRRLFPFAAENIGSIYALRGDASTLRIALLMTFVIGPGEEIIWRGFVQRHLADRMGPLRGLALATALYGAVHIATGNVMLVLAALVCGAFWGLLYLRFKSLAANCLSHALWDIAVFLVIPFS